MNKKANHVPAFIKDLGQNITPMKCLYNTVKYKSEESLKFYYNIFFKSYILNTLDYVTKYL